MSIELGIAIAGIVTAIVLAWAVYKSGGFST
jgi:hypothetical protein